MLPPSMSPVPCDEERGFLFIRNIPKKIIVECDEHDIWRRANINWRGVPDNVKLHLNRNNFREEDLIQLAVA